MGVDFRAAKGEILVWLGRRRFQGTRCQKVLLRKPALLTLAARDHHQPCMLQYLSPFAANFYFFKPQQSQMPLGIPQRYAQWDLCSSRIAHMRHLS